MNISRRRASRTAGPRPSNFTGTITGGSIGLPNYADGMEEMFRHPDYKATAEEREYPRIKARILKEGATKFDHKHAAETAQWERERQRMLLHE